jgi:hypothetical protein
VNNDDEAKISAIRRMVALGGASAWLLISFGTADAQEANVWQPTGAATDKFGAAIAVCLSGDEIVCIGVGCGGAEGFDFVEMIAGNWLERPTRLSAGSTTATITMKADGEASQEFGLPVSRGPVDKAFLSQIAGQDTLRLEAEAMGYVATFPLAGFDRALEALPNICAGGASAPTLR